MKRDHGPVEHGAVPLRKAEDVVSRQGSSKAGSALPSRQGTARSSAKQSVDLGYLDRLNAKYVNAEIRAEVAKAHISRKNKYSFDAQTSFGRDYVDHAKAAGEAARKQEDRRFRARVKRFSVPQGPSQIFATPRHSSVASRRSSRRSNASTVSNQ